MSKEREILKQLFPYLDCIICYASTIEEHLPNRLYKEIEELLAEPEAEFDWIVGEGLKPITKKDLLILQQTEPGLATLYDTPLWDHPPHQPVQLSDDEILNHYEILAPHVPYKLVIQFAKAIITTYEKKQNEN